MSAAEFDEVVPLIAAYQRFYAVAEPSDERNRAFFARFLAPSEDGMLLRARGDDGAGPIRGYACLYWHFSSLDPGETVLMNDLFVVPEARGEGVGRALIEAALEVARERGCKSLEWSTAPDNQTAQRLYDSTGATRSTWFSYELDA